VETIDPVNRKVVIAGGSGFLGTSLAAHLTTAGYAVVVLTRHPTKSGHPWRYVQWEARELGAWVGELDTAVALINLTGRTVDCIKTPDHCDEILHSRLESTRVLGHAMRAIGSPPLVWIQMSTAHIYGDPPELVCTEDSAFGYGFAPNIGKAWEEAFHASILPSQRGVILRPSFVIGLDRGAGGGAMARLLTLVRWGLGGTVGSGKQGMSWIHETDLNRLFERALTNDNMWGAYIASSPNPLSQKEFMRILRRTVGMPIGLPAFEWMVRIGAPLLMKTDPELALYGRFVVPKRLLEEGFEFRYPSLEAAIANLISESAIGRSLQSQLTPELSATMKP
jgi:hypothetical protein